MQGLLMLKRIEIKQDQTGIFVRKNPKNKDHY